MCFHRNNYLGLQLIKIWEGWVKIKLIPAIRNELLVINAKYLIGATDIIDFYKSLWVKGLNLQKMRKKDLGLLIFEEDNSRRKDKT